MERKTRGVAQSGDGQDQGDVILTFAVSLLGLLIGRCSQRKADGPRGWSVLREETTSSAEDFTYAALSDAWREACELANDPLSDTD